jgi:hypothetical protein
MHQFKTPCISYKTIPTLKQQTNFNYLSISQNVVTRADVQRMIERRCVVTVGVQELRQQNCQVTQLAKLPTNHLVQNLNKIW